MDVLIVAALLNTVGDCICVWMLNHMLNTHLWLKVEGLRCI